MNFRKLISLFLFLVLMVQVLPMQQIAAWLSSGQVTEEIAHSIGTVKAKSSSDDVFPPFGSHPYGAGFFYLSNAGVSGQHPDEELQIRHADDIISPPPNGKLTAA